MIDLFACSACKKDLKGLPLNENWPIWCSEECAKKDPKWLPLPEVDEVDPEKEELEAFRKKFKELKAKQDEMPAEQQISEKKCSHKYSCRAHREICIPQGLKLQ